MATKKELVKELLDMGVEESKTSLQKKTNSQLEKMINSLSVQSEDTKDNDILDDMKKELEMKIKAEMEEKLRKQIEEEMKSKNEEASAPVRKKEQMDKSEEVPVMNITNHQLIYQSRRTGAEWLWLQYGDIEYIEVQELLTMRSSQRKFLDNPWILIMDDRAVNFLGLDKMYDKMIHPDKIDSVFDMGLDDFKDVLETAPKGIAQLIVSRAVEKYNNGTFDSVHKIKAVNEKFNTHIGE